MSENKVQFGLKNVHYAKLTKTVATSGISYSWATPVHVPGAVTLTLDPQGGLTPFYADNVIFYNAANNNGYSGDLEMARFPDQMRVDIWGENLGTTSKVLTESSDDVQAEFALLYQIDGDVGDQYYVLYCCTATRPGAGSATNTETKDPQTQSCTITAIPLEDGRIMARTTDNTPDATKAAWFSTVFEETV